MTGTGARGWRRSASVLPAWGWARLGLGLGRPSAPSAPLTQAFQPVECIERLARRHLVRFDVVKFVQPGACGRRLITGLAFRGDGREQRQFLERRAGAAFPTIGLEDLQDLAGAARNRIGQARQAGNMDAVGAVCRAGAHLVQEDDLVFPFLDVDRDVGDLARRSESVVSSW